MPREGHAKPAWEGADALTLALITVVLWSMAFVALCIIDSGVGYTMAVQVRRGITCLIGATLCGLLGLFYRRLSLQRISPLLITGLAGSVACAVVFSAISHMAFFEIQPLGRQPWSIPHQAEVAGVVFWFFGAWSACYLAVALAASARQARQELERSRLLSLQAQHKMLRYQINPHFLFNSLNAILALVLDAEVERAEEVITSLSAFLRIALEQDPELMIPIALELKNARAYLAVEKARFGDRLIVVEDVDPATLSAQIPSMVMQPLLENAVRYGLADSSAPVTVRVAVETSQRRVRVLISDNALYRDDAGSKGSGVGQVNVRKRLQLAFGADVDMRFGPTHPNGYRCELCFPRL